MHAPTERILRFPVATTYRKPAMDVVPPTPPESDGPAGAVRSPPLMPVAVPRDRIALRAAEWFRGSAAHVYFGGPIAMKHLLVVMVPIGALLLVLSGIPDTRAQQPKKAAKAGTIELIKSKDGKYRFSIRDADGKYLGGSAVGHETEKDAKEAVEELKKVLPTATYVSKSTEDAKDSKDAKDTKSAKDK
jgi:hypothetical protein